MKKSSNGSLDFLHIGPYRIMEPSKNSTNEMLQKADEHLRSNYSPGDYNDSTKCNEILKFMYRFYESELDALVPKFATAWWVAGIIFQYEQSGKISSAYKMRELSTEDTTYWRKVVGEDNPKRFPAAPGGYTDNFIYP